MCVPCGHVLVASHARSHRLQRARGSLHLLPLLLAALRVTRLAIRFPFPRDDGKNILL